MLCMWGFRLKFMTYYSHTCPAVTQLWLFTVLQSVSFFILHFQGQLLPYDIHFQSTDPNKHRCKQRSRTAAMSWYTYLVSLRQIADIFRATSEPLFSVRYEPGSHTSVKLVPNVRSPCVSFVLFVIVPLQDLGSYSSNGHSQNCAENKMKKLI